MHTAVTIAGAHDEDEEDDNEEVERRVSTMHDVDGVMVLVLDLDVDASVNGLLNKVMMMFQKNMMSVTIDICRENTVKATRFSTPPRNLRYQGALSRTNIRNGEHGDDDDDDVGEGSKGSNDDDVASDATRKVSRAKDDDALCNARAAPKYVAM